MAYERQEFDVSPRDIPGRRDRDGDWDDDGDGYHHRIHAPGGGIAINSPIVIPGRGGNGRRRGRDRGREELPVPPPAPLPLDGSELLEMWDSVTGFPFLRRVTTPILDFIRNFWPPSYSWKSINAKADIPLTALFALGGQDQIFELVWSVVCKTQDAGAGTGLLTINFVPLDTATPSPITQTCNLAVVGDGATGTLPILLAAGSGVSFDFTGGGPYGAASYDIIVSAIPKSSDQPGNAPNNLLW